MVKRLVFVSRFSGPNRRGKFPNNYRPDEQLEIVSR